VSTRSTILLTNENEHWYRDCNGAYHEETSTEECLVLELDKRHKVEQDEDGTRIIIEEDTPLYQAILELIKGDGKTQIIVL